MKASIQYEQNNRLYGRVRLDQRYQGARHGRQAIASPGVCHCIVTPSHLHLRSNPKDVHITGGTLTHVEGNHINNIYVGRDKRTKRVPFDDPSQLSMNYLLPLRMPHMNGVDL